MKKLLLLLIVICVSSCAIPHSCCDNERSTYYPSTYYQPTRTIVVKQKPHKHYKKNKRHVKVKINKHRKTK